MNRLAVVLLSILPLACSGEKGSGKIKTEQRSLPAFTSVDVGNGIAAEISIGPSAPVEVRGDDNLLAKVETEVSDGCLNVRMKMGSTRPTERLSVRAVTPQLTKLIAGTGAELQANGLSGARLEIETGSGGSVTARGSVGALSLDASSGSRVEAGELDAADVEANVSSGAKATVTATRAVSGSASAGASLRVRGKPAKRDVSTQSGGHVDYD